MNETVIRHSDRVFSIDGFLTPTECARLIGLAEGAGFQPADVRAEGGQKAMPQIRNNDRVMVPGGEWVETLWSRLAGFEFPVVEGLRARGLPRDLRFYRYAPGQRFKMHKDGPWKEDGMVSKLSFLVYLNHGFVGGDTDFREFRVVPKTGSALLFIHDTWHEGAAVEEGLKYVLRSDVMYT